jgi:hypothetical protein
VRHRVREGRGADRRGAAWRRQGRSPVAEQEEALVSGGGMGWRMQWHEIRRAAGGRAGGTGSIGQDGGGGGVRASSARLNGRVGKRWGVGQAMWGRSGGRGAWGHTLLGWSVGPLGPGDGPLVHHPM